LTGNDRQRAVDPRIARSVSLIRSLPLRWFDSDGGSTKESVLARGWFLGADECARILATQAPLEVCEGRGFGASWPILEGGVWAAAPALPAVMSGETASGADGEYRHDTRGVWREAGGVEELYLTTDVSRPSPGAPFDLLWYGETERFLVRDGELEIEDLFGILRLPATPQLLDRILLRSRHVEREVMAGLPMTDREGPQTIEVRRSAILSNDDRWRDAAIYLTARADIERARRRGAIVEARVVGGSTVIFGCDEDEDGWLLTLRKGSYVFSEVRVARRTKTLSLCATLDGEIDAMAPGMRGRLIFDLRTDLVTLG
jgi:hypothetical protein